MTARRIPDGELEEYENAVARCVNIRNRIKRAQYWTDDPDLLEEYAYITIQATELQRFIHTLLERRRGE